MSHRGCRVAVEAIVRTIERIHDNWKASTDGKCEGVTRTLEGLRLELGERKRPALNSADEFQIDPIADEALRRHASARADLERAARALREATRTAIAALKAAGISNNDIAEFVGLSRSRVQQLAVESADDSDSRRVRRANELAKALLPGE